ncbi:ring-cleaving dioxygenase [Parasedimentitalea marina]|uniref:Ring-cleaving dioxygenase n=1 Tax=Parasedimentitalea marina TaxID=2483033 RepID=A0A3T0N7G1_9RHOB|nr:VOC family protein [Parasedimentitalea marina]AZV79892.1 ring-cleaving dioxygenase [Parasedimentitalea marina]
MKKYVKGLHHVTSIANDAFENNLFFTQTLAMRRVKKTVNFDSPGVYHLYYGDKIGTPGSIMTYFPFHGIPKGQRGTGEVGITEFAIPNGALTYWKERLVHLDVSGLFETSFLGEARLEFNGPDKDRFAFVETDHAGRTPWSGSVADEEVGILGLNGVRLSLRDSTATGELLTLLGYQKVESTGNVARFRIMGGNPANTIDLEELPASQHAFQGAGSVHHIAFAVEDRAAQLEARRALLDAGLQVTPVIDRDYFWSVYFRAPCGVLFEIATNGPGFDRDEDTAHLGEKLKLPRRYHPYREHIERKLPQLV